MGNNPTKTMEDVLVVDEKFSRYWIWAFGSSAIFSLSLFIFSQITSNTLLEGYLQLGAFICFSVAIFSIVKIREGKKNIRVSFKDKNLVVDILKSKDTLKRDKYSLKDIKDLQLLSSQISIPFLNIFIDRKDAATFQLQLEEEDKPFYLFQFGGQIISVNHKAAARISDFLEAKNINVTTAR